MFTEIPVYWVGCILDHGKATIYALHLLAFKLSKGPGFTLNQAHVKRKLGMGWRAFQAGMRVLVDLEIIERRQPSRNAYAIEIYNEPPAHRRGYIRLDDRMLTEQSTTVAFALCAGISPYPRRASDVARRIGVKSRDTTRAAAARCAELGAIELWKDTKQSIWVRRLDAAPYGMIAVKNGVAENGVTENGATHNTKKEDHRENGSTSQYKEIHHTHALRNGGHTDQNELLALKDWKQAEKIRSMNNADLLLYYSTGTAAWSCAQWITSVDDFGRVPPHLKLPFAAQQASEIARVAVATIRDDSTLQRSLEFDRAMIGIVNAVCEAVRRGKIIRSLAIVAVPILKSCRSGDLDWAFYCPSPSLKCRLAAYRLWAESRLLPKARASGHSVDTYELLSTSALERLAALDELYGRRLVELAIATTARSSKRTINDWASFRDAAERLSRTKLGPQLVVRKLGRKVRAQRKKPAEIDWSNWFVRTIRPARPKLS